MNRSLQGCPLPGGLSSRRRLGLWTVGGQAVARRPTARPQGGPSPNRSSPSVADYSEAPHRPHRGAPNAVEIRPRRIRSISSAPPRSVKETWWRRANLLFVVDPRPYQASLARAARAELDERSKPTTRLAKKETPPAPRSW